MNKKAKQYSAKEKSKIILEAIKGEVTMGLSFSGSVAGFPIL